MNYSLYQTNDKSFTLKNHTFDEHYHSNAGAWQEAQLKYFEGCKLLEKLESGSITIFEVGFGLGYNLIPILNVFDQLKHKITFISSEFDTALFSKLSEQSEELYPKTHLAFFQNLLNEKEYISDALDIHILEGDVRQSILSIEDQSIDAVFHDPFSPYKNTECWTQEFFSEEFRILKSDGILSTYSMSTPVRSGLFLAGFYVWEGIGDETKSTGTLATKQLIEGVFPLPEKMKRKLTESPERIPFRDSESRDLDRQEIKRIRNTKKEANDYSDCVRENDY